ncbi:MAG: enoyl-CoA hydratase [Dehalococcoidia bacterium]|nr:enoyl-CoA hydratase [Dehalococcoidia bacterium]MYK25757.1 enoyl-CoA hydratase [Dehalococcoidia bacterium]
MDGLASRHQRTACALASQLTPPAGTIAAVDYQHILYDVADGIATITLNRPERLNAFDNLMLSEWRDAIERSDADRDVRVIILTGAGRGFCSGMDVAHETAGEGVLRTEESVAERRHSLRNSVHHIPRALVQLEKPYIAAVNGAAVGAGMDMASMADIRFASERARFGMGYVRMGLIPGDGGAYTLPRIVGTAKALDLIWSGELIDAQEALRIGYVSEVCPPEELLDRTREFAQKIARGPATAIQLAKKLVYRSANLTFDEHLDFAQMAMTLAQSTEDAKEGPLAFTEKREPNFKGY